jgi:hypothetical protein
MDKKEEMRKSVETELKKEFDEEKIKEDILSKSEIALWLDTYDDIFSDFDPRPFTQRAVSVDFLDEIRRASRDKVSGQIELRFLIPKDLRKESDEQQIKKRLKDHFKKHADETKKEVKKTLGKGLLIAALGFASMFVSVIVYYYVYAELLKVILTTLLEPAGWFLMFYGFDMAFYTVRAKHPEVEFYEKMSKSDITFVTY